MDDDLRDLARHRGFKLVRSRRRKPGTGDFGKFGLTDQSGKPLLGIAADGLSASAQDIEEYLRAGSTDTWQQSARLTPDRPKLAPLPAAPAQREKRVKRVKLAPAAKPSAQAALPPPPKPAAPTAAPVPSLVIRPAKPADLNELAKLIAELSGSAPDQAALAARLAVLKRQSAGIQVATRGPIVGAVAWAAVPTLQHGLLGRITLLVVVRRHRRQGIAAKLLATAETALGALGCTTVEAISDIAIEHSHGFFRAAGFAQTSHRFTRQIDR